LYKGSGRLARIAFRGEPIPGRIAQSGSQVLPKQLRLFLIFGAVSAGCGSTPTAPDGNANTIVAIGPQVLRIVYQAPCAQLDKGVIPLTYTRVNVATSSNEWVATAGSTAAGDVQIRFRQSGQSVMSGSIPITGTIAGTAVHMPELFPGPAWNVRVTFGGPASLTGVAFTAGVFGATTSGIDGTGNGSLTVTDAIGNTCNGTTFSWSIFPPP
jgi:hypothetical protein